MNREPFFKGLKIGLIPLGLIILASIGILIFSIIEVDAVFLFIFLFPWAVGAFILFILSSLIGLVISIVKSK